MWDGVSRACRVRQAFVTYGSIFGSLNRRLGRRTACVGTAVVLGVSVLTYATPGFSTTPAAPPAVVAASDSDDDGILDAKDTGSAAEAAAAQGERVEDLSQRTDNSSVYANKNGTFTQRDFGGTIRVKKSGDWVPVDYTLTKQSDGSYVPKASDLDITIDGGSAKEAARVTRDDGTSLAFTWPTNLPEPSVDGGVATYKISDATDLIVAVTGSGVTARIRLNEMPTEDDPVFRLGLRADGVDVDQTATGGLKITDETGKAIGSTTQLSAWDATKDAAGDPANMVDLDAELGTTSMNGDVTQHTLDLTTPDGWLSDPDRSWPVVIDPDISMNQVRDTWVRVGDTASHAADQRLIVGKIDPATTTNPGPTRSYLKFYNSILETSNNIEIISAEMGLWQYYGYSCADSRMYIYPVAENWNDTITWATRPLIKTGNGATHIEANRGATGCGTGWTKVNLTTMAKAWNDGTVDMQGVQLSAGDENYSSYERRFCSMNPDSDTACSAARRPYLDVTYNSFPHSASTPTADVVDGNVTLDTTVSDPDGGVIRAKYELKRTDGRLARTEITEFGVSGDELAVDVPSLPVGSYTVQAWADDGRVVSRQGSPLTQFEIESPTIDPITYPDQQCEYEVELAGTELAISDSMGASGTPTLVSNDPAQRRYVASFAGEDVEVTVWMGAAKADLQSNIDAAAADMDALKALSISEAVEGENTEVEVAETFDTQGGAIPTSVPIAYRVQSDEAVEFGLPNTAECGQLSATADRDVAMPTAMGILTIPGNSPGGRNMAAATYPETTTAIRYRTFIPAKKATTKIVCGTFKGDGRKFDSHYEVGNRTRASVFFNWPDKTIDTTKNIGTTHRLKAYGFSKKSKTASAKGIKFHSDLMYATYGKISVTHSVGNPLCGSAGAIRYNLVFEAWKDGSARIAGKRGQVPNHEAYVYPKSEAKGKKIFTRKHKSFICLSINCGDESLWEIA